MRKIVLLVVVAVFLFAAPAFTGSGENFSATELKLMGSFLSNYTELANYDFDAETLLKSNSIISFGIHHNYNHNYESLIKSCHIENCPHGGLVIDRKHVEETIKKYFGVDFKDHRSIKPDHEFFMEYVFYYDGEFYHFEGGELWIYYYAKVDKAVQNSSGQIVMTGELYDSDDENDIRGTFEAVAKPYKYDGKDTWAIISIKSEIFPRDDEEDYL
jgi:hypothetical protein